MWNAEIDEFTWYPKTKTLKTSEKKMNDIGIDPTIHIRNGKGRTCPDLRITNPKTEKSYVFEEILDDHPEHYWLFTCKNPFSPVQRVEIWRQK